MIVEFDPDARAEFLRASEFCEDRRPGYGLKFVWAIERATESIGETPHAGSPWPDTPAEPPIRRRQVPGFPSVTLAYAVLPDRIYVLAVVHEKRAPGYWLARLKKLDP